MNEAHPRYLSKHQVAELLHLTPGTVAVLASQGRIPAIRLKGPKGACRKLLFDRADLDKMLQEAKSW